MAEYRMERDSMGDIRVPSEVYYGAQTQRAVANFPISGWHVPAPLIHALGLVKYACAAANRELDRFSKLTPESLNARQVDAILHACREVAEGQHDDQFPIDVFQTGSGTSTNMNGNEVIANRAVELSGGDRFAAEKPIHPNDHVNLGQSSNDVFPTAIHVAVVRQIDSELLPALQFLTEGLMEKSQAWDEIVKIGRTHLMDATPLRLGQEFGGFGRQLELSVERARQARDELLELPLGGTAVGTGINTHPQFASHACRVLAEECQADFVEAENHFEANAQRDRLVCCHAQIRTIAVTMFHVSNNIRLLASGPRCGIHEITLPALQPGSSIMPGKVNPVICESVMQVAARVMGNDHVVAFSGAAGGQFQLHVMMPVMAHAVLQSVQLLSSASRTLSEFCIQGMEANEEACREMIEKSLAMATALTPVLGYDRSAALAKEAFQRGISVRELCTEKQWLSEAELEEMLDPMRLTEPGA